MSMQSKKRRDLKKKAQKKKMNAKKGGRMNKFQQNHLDLLQNIEFVLVNAYRNDNSVDDVVIQNALQKLMYDKPCVDPRSQLIVDQLHQIREMRSDISDNIWEEALRMILESVHNHSSLTPGSRGYLDFVSDFII